jgi:hypothetical protein
MTSTDSAPFCYDPDYRSRVHPKDHTKPFCCRCQHNIDTSKAIPVTINEESLMAVIGHGRSEELNPNPNHPESTWDTWIGKDCLARLKKEGWIK